MPTTDNTTNSIASVPGRCFTTGGYWQLVYSEESCLAVVEFHTPQDFEIGAVGSGSVGVRYLVVDRDSCNLSLRIRIGKDITDIVVLDHAIMHWFSPERARAIWNATASSHLWKVAD